MPVGSRSTSCLPAGLVIRFDLTDRPRERCWMLVDRPESEVCVKSPGVDEELVVTTRW